MARRHELADAQWAQIKDLLPGKRGDPGRTAADNRRFVNAVPFVLETGVPWRDLPARYGSPNSVRRRFDRRCAAGAWERVAAALGDPDLEEVRPDSTTVTAHPVAAAGRRRPGEKKRTRTPAGASAAAAAG